MLTSSGKPASTGGFTLVEIMVVLLIMGLALGVLFRLDYSTAPQALENTAREFTGNAELVLQEAVLSGDFWGIDFFTRETGGESVFGYRWLHLVKDSWQEDLPAGMDDFPVMTLLEQKERVALAIEGLPVEPEPMTELETLPESGSLFAPEIWLYPNHETTAFSVRFSHADAGSRKVQADMLGRFRLEKQP